MNKKQQGFGIVEVILIIVIIGLLGFIGWYVWSTNQKTSSTNETAPTQTDAYAGWKTYTSPTEKLSFKYPSDWQVAVKTDATASPGADTAKLTDPSGKGVVSWYSVVSGIGGVCDDTYKPGDPAIPASEEIGVCPYWSVLDKQKIAGADLYYVAGVVTTDGTTYRPWCSLQAEDGITSDQSSVGFMLFDGKNNRFSDSPNSAVNAGLVCGTGLGSNVPEPAGTKEEAAAFFETTEGKQSKLILLSASY